MAEPKQKSLLSRGPLFDRQVREQYLSDRRQEGIPAEATRAQALQEWVDAVAGAGSGKETSLEQHFNQKVLVETLGFDLYPGPHATAWPKAPTAATRIKGEPDVLLGTFKPGEPAEFSAVVELKQPGTNLDAPQPRSRALTPIQQAFEYGEQVIGVRWVLVTDMRVVRLYSVESPYEFERFDLAECVKSGVPTAAFRDLYWLLSSAMIVAPPAGSSPLLMLYERSVARQLAVRDGFYQVYYEIRRDLIDAVQGASSILHSPPDRVEILTATQRLLDRMMFLYYCEDSPARLIPADTVVNVTDAARKSMGPSTTKVYDQLKYLFREVDAGSPPTAAIVLSSYNGELFKEDPILDAISLPDSLHDKTYELKTEGDEPVRKIRGAWGLHAFDFWRELNEHLLGHIFEQSLSDLSEIATSGMALPDRMGERRRHGIYYTSELLSDHLSQNSLRAVLDERAPIPEKSRTNKGVAEPLEVRRDELGKLRVIDLAAGSGAFLVSSYQALLEEFWQIEEGLEMLRPSGGDLLSHTSSLTQAQLLRESLHGVDLLPQAVEIAKLALWLRSARKGEKVADLSQNIVTANSLDVATMLAALGTQFGTFDLVIGNPPWGAEVDPAVYDACCRALSLDASDQWDSWELFVVLGIALLRDGGRLAFVLPDTIFSPEKARIREFILASGAIEYFHNVGPDWFANVRMGTTIIQLRKGSIPMANDFPAMVLAGARRKEAIAGKVLLSQLESGLSRLIPQGRSRPGNDWEIEVFRSARDDQILDAMVRASQPISSISDHGRGEEMSKAGLLWICPNCFTPNTPARKRKRDPEDPDGPRYRTKSCEGDGCGLELDEFNVQVKHLVVEGSEPKEGHSAHFIDGDDIVGRYLDIRPSKLLRLDFEGFGFKSVERYQEPKILIRQAGVGLLAVLDASGARCPQSVYYYRLTDEAQEIGYSLEFLLGVLLSRTIAFYIFKRFSEVDPARAHAKVTHERLANFPVPKVDFADSKQRRLHDEISENVRGLIQGEHAVGGTADMRIDVALRELYGLTADDGLYINLELADLPVGQAIQELFPKGLPEIVIKPDRRDSSSDVEVAGIS